VSANPLVAPVQDSTTWYTGLGLVEDAYQVSNGISSHSWIDTGLGGLSTGLDMLSMAVDPLGSLASWGVSWLLEHVQPLKEALDWLAGNADEVAAHAATWRNVAEYMKTAHTDFQAKVQSGTAQWLGDSGNAYRQRAQAQGSVLDGISAAAGGISYAVEAAGMLVGTVRGFVRDMIGQCVGTLIARLPQWLAEEGVTLGLATPVVAAQVTAVVAKWVDKIQTFVRGLINSLRRLVPMVNKLGTVFTELSQLLKRLRGANVEADVPATPHPHTPELAGTPGPTGTPAPSTSWDGWPEDIDLDSPPNWTNTPDPAHTPDPVHTPDSGDVPDPGDTPELADAPSPVDAPSVPLTDTDRAAIHDYTGHGYRDMNQYLRESDSPAWFPYQRERYVEDADQVSAGLAKLPPDPGTTYRGVELSPADLDRYQVGQEVTERGFTSTSRDERVATGTFDKNTLMVVTGQNGKDVDPYSYNQGELETLYDKGTTFEVTGKDWDPDRNKWVISLEERG
jgi:hypothetical protein